MTARDHRKYIPIEMHDIYVSNDLRTCRSVGERLQGCEFLSPTTVVNLHVISPRLLSARSPPVNLNKCALCFVSLQLWRV